MELWYRLLSVLPFAWAQPGHLMFMKNALLAILLLAPVFALLGTMIVNNRMSFFSDALGHGAFTGLVIGGMLGFLVPMWAAVIFSVLFSIAVTTVRYRSGMAPDTVIGVFSSAAVALGIFLATGSGGGTARLSAFLIGDILSIGAKDIFLLVLVLAGVLILWALFFNRLLLISISPSLARSRGVSVFRDELLFTVLVAVIVTISMPWIGLLVINSFLVLPAAAARNTASGSRQYTILAVLVSVVSGVVGLFASYAADTATGATIVLVMTGFFFLSMLIGRRGLKS